MMISTALRYYITHDVLIWLSSSRVANQTPGITSIYSTRQTFLHMEFCVTSYPDIIDTIRAGGLNTSPILLAWKNM